MTILGEAVTILLLLLLNGLLAMSEIAVVASRRVRLEQRAAEGSRGAQAALALHQEPTRFLSTVQIGITLIGILSGALGGATMADQLAQRLAVVPGLAVYSEAIALAVVVLGITYFSLIIGELVPKRFAMQRPEAIALLVARPLTLLARVGRPLVTVLSASTQVVLRLLGVRETARPGVTEEEIRAVIEEGREAGVIEQTEQEMVEGVFRLGEARVDRFMTPRTELEWIDLEEDPVRIRDEIVTHGRARFLVCRGSIEQVEGMVHAEDLLAQLLRGEPLDLSKALRPIAFVPATTPAAGLLERFRHTREEMALVLDEFGGVDGMVTLTDLVEEIIGDLRPVSRAQEPIVERPDGGWLVDGTVPVVDLAETLEVELSVPPGVHTVGGWVMDALGHVPKAGESFERAGFRVEVVDMDGRRVDKVLASRVSDALPAGAGDA